MDTKSSMINLLRKQNLMRHIKIIRPKYWSFKKKLKK